MKDKKEKFDINQTTINYIKGLGIDMINQAESGHPGIVLGAAPIMYTLYKNHLNINTTDPTWVNRDRFVMSAGHGSALLYATLYMAGFNITLDDLKNFRRSGYPTPGHPELGETSGVDMSTGPLGQGIASAVGMALGAKIQKEKYVLPKDGGMFSRDKNIIDYKVYVLCGDGDLMEGISYEAASLAGNLQLDNLIVLYDSNDISLDGPISMTFTENVRDRFKSMGWNTDLVTDGNSVSAIDKAINKAKTSNKPTLIEVKTIIGKDTTLAGTNQSHGKVLGEDETKRLKRILNLPETPFTVPSDIIQQFQKTIGDRSEKNYYSWNDAYKKYIDLKYKGNYNLFGNILNSRFNIDITKTEWKFSSDRKATRDTNQEIMMKLGKTIPTLIGGSADLGSSTKTYLHGFEDITKDNYNGQNIWYGVREHVMGAVSNGLATSGFRPFCSTFLSFADYVKPAIRMSALMNLPVTYIFSHDSINIGADGPTHQPIEQLAMLRSIPNMKVFRPADGNELVGAWNEILNSSNPNCLILSRMPVEQLSDTKSDKVKYGAYPILEIENKIDAVIIATGSEVQIARHIALELYKEHDIQCRVVSMPCMELFLKQSIDYKEKLLPSNVKKIVIEAGSSFGWHQFVKDPKCLITVDQFGVSGTKDEVLSHLNFTYKQIKERIMKILL